MSAIDVHDETAATYQHLLGREQRDALDALLVRDPEGWARLRGLIAILSLPPHEQRRGVEDRRKRITVEVEPGVWKDVDRVYVRQDTIVVAQGINGHSIGWTFPLPGPVPAWEWHKLEPARSLPGMDGLR